MRAMQCPFLFDVGMYEQIAAPEQYLRMDIEALLASLLLLWRVHQWMKVRGVLRGCFRLSIWKPIGVCT